VELYKGSVFNNADLDDEHTRILNNLDQFKNCVNDIYFSPKLAAALLAALLSNLDEHFRHEETLMNETRYSHAESHTMEHENLMTTARELSKGFLSGPSQIEGGIVYDFLNEWLINHSVRADCVVGNYFQAHQERPTQDNVPDQVYAFALQA